MKPKKITTVLGIKGVLILAMCILAGGAKSQLYGEYAYSTFNYNLCSGSTGINYPAQPGMVMGGHRVNSPNNFHFIITRTSDGGLYVGNAWEFTKEYSIRYNSALCGAPTMFATSCYGISVIETNPTAGAPALKYVVAGACEGGVFYAELNVNGFVLNTWFSPMPSSLNQIVTKPVICESRVTPGVYYISGNYANRLYAFRYVGGSPGPSVTRVYSPGTAKPAAIVESPFNAKEVTIIGEVTNSSTQIDGFFLQLNNVSLLPAAAGYNTYDINSLSQGFNSMDLAFSTVAGGQGFVIGGYHNATAATPRAWVIKLDPLGNYLGASFSKLIICSSDPVANPVVGIVERQNTVGAFEYYGAIKSSSQLIVVKMNATGTPVANGEFLYGIGPSAEAVALSKINTPGFPDLGLQVYARHRVAAPTNFYFAQSVFSGQSGCSNIKTAGFQTIIPFKTAPAFNVTGSLAGCYNSSFALEILITNPLTAPCAGAPFNGPGAVGGSNAKATGLAQLTVDNGSMGVYPNPATSKISVSFNASIGDNVKIELFDYLGRLITSVPVTVTDAVQTADLNLNSLNIESGIYIVSANINGSISTQKLIYNKN